MGFDAPSSFTPKDPIVGQDAHPASVWRHGQQERNRGLRPAGRPDPCRTTCASTCALWAADGQGTRQSGSLLETPSMSTRSRSIWSACASSMVPSAPIRLRASSLVCSCTTAAMASGPSKLETWYSGEMPSISLPGDGVQRDDGRPEQRLRLRQGAVQGHDGATRHRTRQHLPRRGR